MSPEQEKRFFWQQFLTVANEQTDLYEKSVIRKNKHYIHIKTGVAGCYYATVCNLDKSWVEICIQRKDDSEEIFNDLQRHQGSIEKVLGERLLWVNEKEKQRCKIMTLPVPMGRADKDVKGLSRQLAAKMVNFFNATSPFLPGRTAPATPRKKKLTSAHSRVIRRRSAASTQRVAGKSNTLQNNYENDLSSVDALFKNAMTCRMCFESGVAVQANIDVAQPRLIGSRYFTSSPKIMVIALNPGAGNTAEKTAANRIFSEHLHNYSNGRETMEELFSFQEKYMEKWGTPSGKYLRFYCEGMGLSLNNIAMANIAWCADIHNHYPSAMLNDCFTRHTGPLITMLHPSIVILSGSSTHKFVKRIKQILPGCLVITTLHYAHREGKQAENRELQEVREQIARGTSH